MNRIKMLIILAFALCLAKVFAYDYPWQVEYEIKKSSPGEINKIVKDFIMDNPEFQVYTFYRYTHDNTKEHDEKDLKIGNKFYRLNLKNEDWIPFGKVLCGSVFLKDIGYEVGFYIPHVSGTKKNYIRLVSYSNEIEVIEEKTVCTGKINFFNDVEPTKKEIPIKQSFEKNFLSKLPLKCEYQEPAASDRYISKFLSLFRKRKNFVDE